MFFLQTTNIFRSHLSIFNEFQRFTRLIGQNETKKKGRETLLFSRVT